MKWTRNTTGSPRAGRASLASTVGLPKSGCQTGYSLAAQSRALPSTRTKWECPRLQQSRHPTRRAKHQPLPVKTSPSTGESCSESSHQPWGGREVRAPGLGTVRALQLRHQRPLQSHLWRTQLAGRALRVWLRRSRHQLAPGAGGPAAAASPRRRRWCPGAAAAAAPRRPAAAGRAHPGAAAGVASRRAPAPPSHGPRRQPPGLLQASWGSRSL